MEEGKLAKWLVKEGDTVKSGDIIAEIETDKATMEFEAVDEGRIGALLVPEGAEGIKVNAPIATLLGDDEKPDIASAMQSIKLAVHSETPASVAKPAPKPAPSAKPAQQPTAVASPIVSAVVARPANEARRVFASPLAHRFATSCSITRPSRARISPTAAA
jgi:pyruvate dehydrogenase E2 component (dihydrolipoamide acetyltransferase)